MTVSNVAIGIFVVLFGILGICFFATLVGEFGRWVFKPNKTRGEVFVWGNLLAFFAVILGAICAPKNWDSSESLFVCVLSIIFVVFWTIGIVTQKGFFLSFLWAIALGFASVVVATIASFLTRGIGPCG